MQRGSRGRDDFFDFGDPFASFGRFGSQRSMMSNLYGGRDPFDDPFFTRPFGSMFGSNMLGTSDPFGMPSTGISSMPRNDSTKGPVIEELNSDDEGEGKGENDKNTSSSKEPSIEHPDDDADERKSKHVHNRSEYNRLEGTQPRAQTYSFSKVTYGGLNGAYYTSTTTRRMGSDGVVLEENKAADRTTGQAEHRISKGIHDQGHSFTRKLNSDGKVDTMQTLHNLSEDELAGFEETWKGNANRHLPGWKEGFNLHENAGAGSRGPGRQSPWGGWALPSTQLSGNAEGMGSDNVGRTNPSKKVVRINIE